ncbi:MAG TPA: LptF/LptG family permease [Candidatus Acidoferrales bacterium]|nr:LptF/LptG family permease [Candidatus Acidoferrales bacterium]
MRILNRYVCREVVSHALLGLAIFTFVFFVPQLVQLMELLVQHAASAGETAEVFLCSIPPVLVFTLPMAMLIGVLIGLGRLSADSEIVAINACGISLRRLLVPIGAIAIFTTAVAFAITLWIAPRSLRTLRSLEYRLRASEASFAVQPHVFDERFPHMVLYVQDVSASGARWRGVLLADSNGTADSKLTLARNAIVVADAKQGKLEIHLEDASSHEYNAEDPSHYALSTSALVSTELPLAGSGPDANAPKDLPIAQRNSLSLLSLRGAEALDAQVEFQRRLALPSACFLFALLGVPIGVLPRRGGRAAGFVLTILLVSGYYLLFVMGIHAAQQGYVSPGVGVWGANIATFLAAFLLLRRIEKIRPESRWIEHVRSFFTRRRRKAPRVTVETQPAPIANGRSAFQLKGARPERFLTRGFPLILDLYILRTFFYWMALMLAGFVVLSDAFTLFDLLPDISRHHASTLVIVNYFVHLMPLTAYQLLPLAALVGTLATLGLLAKNNEVTAFKACGISLFRLSMPLILAGLLLTAGMFLLDDTILPYANQRQDALRDQIKGRPAETYFQPAHQWIYGENDQVFNYQFFDPDRNLFGGLSIFEIDPATFELRRRVFASRASWEPALNTWVLEGGWVRDFTGSTLTSYVPFRAETLDELTEKPSYFKREVRQYYQMNWRQLRAYIRGLQQAGFDTSRLSVEWHKKFAYPLITTIIMFLGIPFAFLVGTRGATGGIATAIGIGIVYWSTAALFEALGAVGQLPPFLAGWAPDGIFAFLGLYFFLKMRT